MKNLSLIVAIGENNELGKNNKLIWYLKEDLKFFKENTMHKTIIMGRNTFESLPRLLVGRKHIVLTKKNIDVPKEVSLYHNYEDIKKHIENSNEEFFIIGGSQIYSLFINDVDKMLITEIKEKDEDADVYFPSFDKNEWYREFMCRHEENGIKYSHVKYLRKGVK